MGLEKPKYTGVRMKSGSLILSEIVPCTITSSGVMNAGDSLGFTFQTVDSYKANNSEILFAVHGKTYPFATPPYTASMLGGVMTCDVHSYDGKTHSGTYMLQGADIDMHYPDIPPNGGFEEHVDIVAFVFRKVV